MAVLQIDIDPTNLNQTFTVQLDGATFEITLRHFPRPNRWFADVRDIDGNLVIAGKQLAASSPLISNLFLANEPEGNLTTIDLTGNGNGPGKLDLGNGVNLYYVEAGT